ncbi:MAG TPA: DUF5723 family protein [Bacteroidales bacterium]|jgi:hypothetical protein|nr:DUF5723 family protein [Bacteroidales bacterium]
MLLFAYTATAQIDKTMYFMDRLPQANYINPSAYPECTFFMGGLLLPLVGQLPPPIMFAVNTPFDWNDFVFHGRWEYQDSLIHPLHPNANLDDFLKKVHTYNNFSTDFQLNLLYFGFKQGKNFWSLDISNKLYLHWGVPGDLMKFAILGNGEVRDAQFNGLYMNVNLYNQISLGFKRQVSRYFSVGGKLKYLSGIANVNVKKSNLYIKTAANSTYIRISPEYLIQTNAPVEVKLADNGLVEEVNFLEFNSNNIPNEIAKNVLFTGNRGLAMDLGFSKDWNSEFTYYFNIEDFGYIHWKRHTHNFSAVAEEGFEFKGLIEIEDDKRKTIQDMFVPDSLLAKFDFTYTTDSYRTNLPWKFYAGARYKVTPKFYLGGVARLEKMSFGYRPSAALSLNYRPGKFGLFTLSYSYQNYSFYNIGIGSTTRIGPVQWYFVSDNLLGTIFWPHQSRSLSMRMGCNLVFGYKEKEKPQKALPMFNSSMQGAGNKKVPKFGQVNSKGGTRENKKYKTIQAPKN